MRYVESLNAALRRLLEKSPEVLILGEDLLDPYGGAFKVTRGLSGDFPDRIIPTPVSESGITGAAVGLAVRGMRPVAEIMFGDFLPLCMDQLVNHAAKLRWMYGGQVSVPMVLRAPMGGYRGYGPTHSQTLESLLGTVPGIEMLAPCHFHDPGLVLERAVLGARDPILFIEHKLLYPRRLVPEGEAEKETSMRARTLPGTDPDRPTLALSMVEDEEPEVTVIAYGGMVDLAARAAAALFMKEEIIAEVLAPAAVKPLPATEICERVRRTGRAVVVEEGVRTGGWGAEVASQLQENLFGDLRSPVLRIGAAEQPIPAATHLERSVLPSVEAIESALLEAVAT